MIGKMAMHTKDLTQNNIDKIAKLFPNCVTETEDDEGNLKYAIDFEALKRQLSDDTIKDGKERYVFTWPGKSEAQHLANTPIDKTLRPCREESVNYDTTKNIYIEGDNLDALKLLRETYLGKIKMIYIDPPYNTGNDFIYRDNFKISDEDYNEINGQFDADGNRLVLNTENKGRYHTNWLNMIYPRIKLSSDLLSDDGVILVSIDDNEITNVRRILDEIFDENNHIATFVISSNSAKNNSTFVSVSHEYIVCYAKNKNSLNETWRVKKNNVDEFVKRANQMLSRDLSKEEIHEELLELVKYPRFYDFDHYTYVDERGVYRTDNPGGVPNGNNVTEIIHPITHKPCLKPSGGWRYKDDEIKRKVANGDFEFGKDENVIPMPKRYLMDYLTQVPKSTLFFDSQSSTKWLKTNNIPFDFPKSIELMKYIISMVPNCDLVLDFFSGSATTAHAIMQLNKEEKTNRRYILVQLPEKIKNDKSGYDNICEVGKERIRIAGKSILKECNKIDVGFRCLKIDTSNMLDIFYNPQSLKKNILDYSTDNIKPDRTPEDLLFQVMLELGIELSVPIKEEIICGKKIFNVDDNYLVTCFDKNINNDVVVAIAKIQPRYVVFRDSSMKDDSVAINFEQIFKAYSPNTQTKVI